MQQILIALVAAAFIGLTAAPVTAQEFSVGPHGFGFGEHHHGDGDEYHHRHWHPGGGHWEGGNCRDLRAACMHKDELGEVGRGNCRRYRETCG